MSKIYAIIEGDGRINGTYSSGYRFVECEENVSDLTHYYDNEEGVIRSRQMLDLGVGVNGLTVTLSGLPPGLTVETNQHSIVTGAAPVTIAYDVPGTYSISVSGLPAYMDCSVEVAVDDNT